MATTTTYPVASVQLIEKSGHGLKPEKQINIDNNEAVISNNPAKIYEEYDMLRSKCPVAWTNQYNGYWLLTKYVVPISTSYYNSQSRRRRG